MDPPDRSASLADGLGRGVDELADVDRTAIRAWGVAHWSAGPGGAEIARPALFLVGPDGVVEWRDLTDNWRVRARPDDVVRRLRSAR